MTKEEARQGLPKWLEMAVHNSTYSRWDRLCSDAYVVLGHEGYAKIHGEWANEYVHCSDGYYRRR